jgi:hypothetical protein
MNDAHPSDRPTEPPTFDLDDYARRTCGLAIPRPARPPESERGSSASPAEVPVICASGRVTLEALHLLMFVDGTSSLRTIAERSRVDIARVCEAFTELACAGVIALQRFETPATPLESARRNKKRRSRIDTKVARERQGDDAPSMPSAVNED